MMDFRALSFIVLLVFSVGLASAWGPETHIHICEEAAAAIWGESVVSACLGEPLRACEVVRDVSGDSSYQLCLSQNGVHPALIPDLVFNDSSLHFDFSSCPIPESNRATYSWLCNSSGRDLASEQAALWYDAASDSSDVCYRIRAFCIASNYLADGEMPLYQLMYVAPESQSDFESRIDSEVSGGEVPWRVSSLIVFRQNQRRTTERFEVTSQDIDAIVEGLVDDWGFLGAVVSTTLVDSCSNGIRDGTEGDVDCGGPCPPCPLGSSCSRNIDCVSGLCLSGFCFQPSCSDGIQNQGELGVDCGGPCEPCQEDIVVQPPGFSLNLFFIIIVGILFLACLAFFVLRKARPSKKIPAAGDTSSELRDIGQTLEDVRSELEEL